MRYSVSVINPGESFVYYNHEWIDWSSKEAEEVKSHINLYQNVMMPNFGQIFNDAKNGVISLELATKLIAKKATTEEYESYGYMTPVQFISVDNFPIKAYSEKVEGTVNGISYKLNEDGVLTVTGTGSIENVTENSVSGRAPWVNYNHLINTIVISEGITDVVTVDGEVINVSEAFGQFTGWLMYDNDSYKFRFEDGTLVETVNDADKVSDVFTDVLDGKWYSDEILYVYKRGAMTGRSEGIFAPLENMMRSETITMLYKLEGCPAVDTSKSLFPDVKTKNWYYAATIWGKTNKIITGKTSGKDAGKFVPDELITRQDFTKILYGYAMYKGYDVSVKSATSYLEVKDAKKISGYAITCMNWAYENKLIAKGSNFNPKDNITRREAAVILARFLELYYNQ